MSEHEFDHDHLEHVEHVPDHADAGSPLDDQPPEVFTGADPHTPEPPQLSELPSPGEWDDDPAADEELRTWLDEQAPAFEPPPGTDAKLAEELVGHAERDGADADDLVRGVMGRLGLPQSE
jgi:hypothetical protein